MTDLAAEQRAEKIAQCADALPDLKEYRAVGTVEYVRAHPDTYYAICYRFISAIESLFDIGQYALTDRNLRAQSQREIPTLLEQAGLIPPDLTVRFTAMYGFRNRLVHA